MKTGGGNRWPDFEKYWGTASRDPDTLHDEMKFPGMATETAQYIVDNLPHIKGRSSALPMKTKRKRHLLVWAFHEI